MEVFDHVRLVVIAELMREIEPRGIVTHHLCVECGLEPRDASVELRAEADIAEKTSLRRCRGRRETSIGFS
jgi:hypothetical protein